MNRLRVAILALAVASCSYDAETITTPANNLAVSYGAKIPGKWALEADGTQLGMTLRPSDINCSAHSFPVSFTNNFPASVRGTLENVFDDVSGLSDLSKGTITIRGERVDGEMRVVPGFVSGNIQVSIDISATAIINTRAGRLFGKTFDGHGRADVPVGAFCKGGAEAVRLAAEKAQRDLLRHLGEDLANADRLRKA